MGRKAILYIALSLDGYIADSKGDVSWLGGENSSYEGDFGYSEFISNIDTVLMGMTTYKQIATELSPEVWMYEGLKTYVMTHGQEENKEEIEFVNGDVCALLGELKLQEGKDIWICGGANIIHQLMEGGFIDKYYLSFVPVILGGGIPLFKEQNKMTALHLLQIKEEDGLVCCIYETRKNSEMKND